MQSMDNNDHNKDKRQMIIAKTYICKISKKTPTYASLCALVNLIEKFLESI